MKSAAVDLFCRRASESYCAGIIKGAGGGNIAAVPLEKAACEIENSSRVLDIDSTIIQLRCPRPAAPLGSAPIDKIRAVR